MKRGKPLKRASSPKRSARPIARRKPVNKRSPKKHKVEIRRKDAEVQKAVSGWGNCFNCLRWRLLGGDHKKKRRFLATRHDPKNIRPCCWPCNVALASFSLAQLIREYPHSPLVPEWEERHQLLYGRPAQLEPEGD